MWVERTQVEILSENSFKYCKSLTVLSVNENKVVKVPGMIFVNNPNLNWLQMRDNKIEVIDENAFYGEKIMKINKRTILKIFSRNNNRNSRT